MEDEGVLYSKLATFLQLSEGTSPKPHHTDSQNCKSHESFFRAAISKEFLAQICGKKTEGTQTNWDCFWHSPNSQVEPVWAMASRQRFRGEESHQSNWGEIEKHSWSKSGGVWVLELLWTWFAKGRTHQRAEEARQGVCSRLWNGSHFKRKRGGKSCLARLLWRNLPWWIGETRKPNLELQHKVQRNNQGFIARSQHKIVWRATES